jgi:hypothetical protein
MILAPEVLTLLLLNVLFTFFSVIAFGLSIKIFFNWNIESVSQTQYKLEKQSFLTATIIKYIFLIKVPLFLFFIFTLDKISNLLTGAMCAAGVVDATPYGTYLFILKIINLYLFAYWLVLHHQDMKYENQPYTKLKFGIFIVAFFLFIAEIVIETLMFTSIEVDKMVSCCGTLYSSSANSALSTLFSIDTTTLLSLFYGNFFLIALFYFLKKKYLFSIANLLFVIISLVSIIVFFGTYIYQLPTHHCPFCFLQSDYYYVGYLIYTLLFLGTFYGIVTGFIKESPRDTNKNFKISIIFNSFYVILLSLYPIIFYIKNGVWL